MKNTSIPYGALAALIAEIETARGVTLAPAKDSRRANP